MTKLPEGLRKVIVFSGHMIDRSDRNLPRFPQAKETAVQQAIELKLVQWDISKNDLGICSGACGGDILFAELCLAQGSQVRLMLGVPIEEFLTESVRIARADWENRFIALRKHPRCEIWVREDSPSPSNTKYSDFEESNRWIFNVALKEAHPRLPLALVVWDEKPYGEGRGGTSHFVSLLRARDCPLVVVNPTLLHA